jgi:hypothetical protein
MAESLNRWQRLCVLNHLRWMTSLEQAQALGSTTISKVRSEAKRAGVIWLARKRTGTKLTEYTPAP